MVLAVDLVCLVLTLSLVTHLLRLHLLAGVLEVLEQAQELAHLVDQVVVLEVVALEQQTQAALVIRQP